MPVMLPEVLLRAALSQVVLEVQLPLSVQLPFALQVAVGLPMNPGLQTAEHTLSNRLPGLRVQVQVDPLTVFGGRGGAGPQLMRSQEPK
jgi:hypothetical protein